MADSEKEKRLKGIREAATSSVFSGFHEAITPASYHSVSTSEDKDFIFGVNTTTTNTNIHSTSSKTASIYSPTLSSPSSSSSPSSIITTTTTTTTRTTIPPMTGVKSVAGMPTHSSSSSSNAIQTTSDNNNNNDTTTTSTTSITGDATSDGSDIPQLVTTSATLSSPLPLSSPTCCNHYPSPSPVKTSSHNFPGALLQNDSITPSTATYSTLGVKTKTSIHDIQMDLSNPRIKQDIILVILQYLQNEGYNISAMTLKDETNVIFKEELHKTKQIQQISEAILAGDWNEVEKLCNKSTLKNYKSFLYEVYKQQYLEMIDSGEYQKAFTFLTKKLKPLKNNVMNQSIDSNSATTATITSTTTNISGEIDNLCDDNGEFKDLCYLLSCKSVNEVERFKNWDGSIGTSRAKLVEKLQTYINFDSAEVGEMQHIPPNRLQNLLLQAATYQVQHSNYHPTVSPRIKSLLSDYESFVIPNALHKTFLGHKENVKCVQFIGEEGTLIASGSSDNTIQIWRTASKLNQRVVSLSGHKSRIWDLCSSRSGHLLASASADTSVKIWDMKPLIDAAAQGRKSSRITMGNNLASKGVASISLSNTGGITTPKCIKTLTGNTGDVYCLDMHQGENHIATGGYDRIVRLYDIRNAETIRNFQGHTAAVSSVVFNPFGNLIISGSKDNTIRVWDIVSGVCIKKYSQHLGEVTCVEMNSTGTLLLSCSKDNTNRLWDMRTTKPVRRFTGHQNTYTNLVRAVFGPNQSLIVGGSEDGFIYIWDVETGYVVQKLGGHSGTVYQAVWNAKQGLIASCSEDTSVKTWWYDHNVPLNVV